MRLYRAEWYDTDPDGESCFPEEWFTNKRGAIKKARRMGKDCVDDADEPTAKVELVEIIAPTSRDALCKVLNGAGFVVRREEVWRL